MRLSLIKSDRIARLTSVIGVSARATTIHAVVIYFLVGGYLGVGLWKLCIAGLVHLASCFIFIKI